MPPSEFNFAEHTDTHVGLFIANPVIKRHTLMTLKALKFTEVTDYPVPRNYFQALGRLIPVIVGNSELVLFNLPSRAKSSETKKNEVEPIYDIIHETLSDIKTHLSKRTSDPLKLLGKTVPIIEVGDYLREKLVEVLFKFRVPTAFFLSSLPPSAHLQGARKDKQVRENFQTHFQEISAYLTEYFRDKDQLVARADAKGTETELSERKQEYDDLMIQALSMREEGRFEEAISVLRQAIEVFPSDIEAYLESGRLYLRRREYGRAISRFSQAEDLFQGAPAPNKEIANVRLYQVQEKIEAGADPRSPEIMKLLGDAVENYEIAQAKAEDMAKDAPDSPELAQPVAIGQEILKWNTAEMLGPKHPIVKQLMDVARKSTQGLESLPLEELSAVHCISLGLQALEAGDLENAYKYYFHALNDKDYFPEACTEINLMGIRLRKMKLTDEAIKIYNRLIEYKPPNLGSVYWNMSVAYATSQKGLEAAGYAARCLYIDPFIAREKEFYDSLTPQLVPIVMRLMKTLKLILRQAQKGKPPAGLVQRYQAYGRMQRLIEEKKSGDAIKLFLALFKQAPDFIKKQEFYGDGIIPRFLLEVRASLMKRNVPQTTPHLKMITAWLKYVTNNPTQKTMAHFLRLSSQAMHSLEETGDQSLGAYYLGQALIIMPEAYFLQPDFYARENLPPMARELATKLKFVDVKRFPKFKQQGRKPDSGRDNGQAAAY